MNIVVFYSIRIWLVVLAFSVGQSHQHIEHFDQHSQAVHREQMIASAILDMMETSFIREKRIRVFNFYSMTLGTDDDRRNRFFGDIVDRVMRSVGDQIGVRIGVQQTISEDNDRHYSVLLVDSAESLDSLYQQLWEHHLNILGYYIILLHTFQKHYSDDLHKIMRLNFRNGVINANILVNALPNLVLLFTEVPYSQYHCNGVAPVIKNKYINSSWQHDKFFPEKLRNLHECPLICATWEELPYFEGTDTSDSEYIGIEGKLLEYLKRGLNFSVKFRWMNEGEIARTLEENGAIFHELFENRTDFVVGAFHFKATKNGDPYEPTTSYFLSSYKFIVRSYTDPYEPFVKLLFPFVYEVWCLILLVFVVGIIISLTVGCRGNVQKSFILGNNNTTPIYNVFVVTLGGSVSPLPLRNFARFILFQWIVASMVLRSAYQGFLYHFIRTDMTPPPPNTIQNVLDLNYKILMTNITFASVRHFKAIQNITEFLDGSEYDNFHRITSSSVKIGILTAYEYFGYYKRTHGRNDKFHMVQQTLFTQQLSIYMRKNSIMLSHFNQLILQFNSFGLMNKVVLELIDSPRVMTNGVDEIPKIMEIRHLYGPNQILFIGHALAGLVLVCEVFFNFLVKIFRKISEYKRRKR